MQKYISTLGLVSITAIMASCTTESSNTGKTSPQVTNDAVIVTGTKLKRENYSYATASPVVAAPGYMDQSVAPVDREAFPEINDNPIKRVIDDPVSTFSIDVDTAAYALMRRNVNAGRMPNPDAVRVEELINYFDYNTKAAKTRDLPFAVDTEYANSPFHPERQLVKIAIKGYEPEKREQKNVNLTLLVDVSGSMGSANKLPLAKTAMKRLVENLGPKDTISIVTYASRTGVVLEPTSARQKSKIFKALDNMQAGGSTAGASGIDLAYKQASKEFDGDKVNRVMVLTDGDFNVGPHSPDEIKELIEEKRDTGIYLSVLGFGMNNYQGTIAQAMAQNGNGNAAYIDTPREAKKVFENELNATLLPIANDVKIQVEFNPQYVGEYRLIGYETRILNREDFNNDKVDAGDIGAGHAVMALYEITPKDSASMMIDPLRYQAEEKKADIEYADFSDELAFVKIRYKKPGEDTSNLISTPINIDGKLPMSDDFRWAAAVAGYGQLLRDNKYLDPSYDYKDVLKMAKSAKGRDKYGYRKEFIDLVDQVRLIADKGEE